MDAVKLEREEEIDGLLWRLSELLIEEQREQGVYQQSIEAIFLQITTCPRPQVPALFHGGHHASLYANR